MTSDNIKQLERSNNDTLLTAILDNAQDGIITIGERGGIESFNKAAERIFGYTAHQVIGCNVNILMPSPYHEKHNSYLLNFDLTGNREAIGNGREVVGRHKNGSTFPICIVISEMLMDGKRKYLGIVRDISERVKIERMKTEFVSTVSHELRTPLTSIRGSLALLVGGVMGTLAAPVKSLVDIAHKNSERLILLINDILDMDKIETGSMEFLASPIKLMPVLRLALVDCQSLVEQYQVNIELEGDLPEVMVNADPNRLAQSLSNLLSNAAKFSPAGDKVILSISGNGQRVRIAVKDHGSGISEQFQDQIFHKFAQADSSDTRKKGGTGLGLAITKAMIEKMGGSIGFESEPNVETTFFIEFPVWHEASVAATIPSQHAAENVLATRAKLRPKVLHIEHDNDISSVVNAIVAQMADVENVPSLVEGQHKLQNNCYNLVILDNLLPDDSGLDLLPLLNGAQPPIPVLVFSSHEIAQEDAQKVRAVLVKSRTDNAQLYATIKRLIGVE